MLSYQHAYHAGNHADILKHYILFETITYLNRKDKPYTFFDTHSGSGLYDLLDNRSLKTGEAQKGIVELYKSYSEKNDCPEDFKFFLQFIEKYLKKNMYPGSPAIETALLREQDKLLLSELHPQEIENLKKNIYFLQKESDGKSCSSVMIHHRSGWEMLKAMTPPDTKRGAVIIDPSYEETEDYYDAARTIVQVFKKWSNGVFLLWYPLVSHRTSDIENMIKAVTDGVRLKNPNTEIGRYELLVDSPDSHVEVSLEENSQIKNPPRLYGSGLLVINEPWGLSDKVKSATAYVESILKN